MKKLEKAAITLGKSLTTIYIIIAFILGSGIIGVIAYEMIGNAELKMIALFIFIGLGLAAGVFAASDSLRMGFFNFITTLSATNELDDKEAVDSFYNSPEH
jgi:hypothetical protein